MASDGCYSLRCSLYGHSAGVRTLGVTDFPEGGIVAGSRDKTISLWKPSEDKVTYSEAHRMIGPSHFISSVCTVPPSTQYPSGLILAGSHDFTIYGFSHETSQPIFKLNGHSDSVSALAAGNFGTVVSGSWDKSARVWLDQKCVMILQGHHGAVGAVAVFPDLGLTLTGSSDKTIRLWRTGSCEKVFRGHVDYIRSLAVLSGFEFLSCSNDATIRLWQTSGECIHVFSGHKTTYCITLLNNAGDFVSCEDGTVKIWRKRTCTETIEMPTKTLWSLACLKNEDIAVSDSVGVVRIFTKHKELVGSKEEIKEFQDQVIAYKKVKEELLGDFKSKSMPDLSALTVPGKDGQIIVCREGVEVFVYRWNATRHDWVKFGSICDDSDSQENN